MLKFLEKQGLKNTHSSNLQLSNNYTIFLDILSSYNWPNKNSDKILDAFALLNLKTIFFKKKSRYLIQQQQQFEQSQRKSRWSILWWFSSLGDKAKKSKYFSVAILRSHDCLLCSLKPETVHLKLRGADAFKYSHCCKISKKVWFG